LVIHLQWSTIMGWSSMDVGGPSGCRGDWRAESQVTSVPFGLQICWSHILTMFFNIQQLLHRRYIMILSYLMIRSFIYIYITILCHTLNLNSPPKKWKWKRPRSGQSTIGDLRLKLAKMEGMPLEDRKIWGKMQSWFRKKRGMKPTKRGRFAYWKYNFQANLFVFGGCTSQILGSGSLEEDFLHHVYLLFSVSIIQQVARW
jgi:hypothetical protein